MLCKKALLLYRWWSNFFLLRTGSEKEEKRKNKDRKQTVITSFRDLKSFVYLKYAK